VYLPEGQVLDGPLENAIMDALPEGATFGLNVNADQRVWILVFRPGVSDLGLTRPVLNAALASLGRPELDSSRPLSRNPYVRPPGHVGRD
jgi:hypothetical protein